MKTLSIEEPPLTEKCTEMENSFIENEQAEMIQNDVIETEQPPKKKKKKNKKGDDEVPETFRKNGLSEIRCSVVVKKLTQDDLDKFGCKGSLTQKNSSSIHAEPILPVSIPPKTPSTTSRFTVEISPCLLAARLSAAGSFMLPISSAIPETVCSPVSPSQESTRNGKQLSKILKDVIDEVSSSETSTRISFEDSPLSTRSSTTIENCDVYDEINSEINLVTEMDSSMPINAPNLPFQTKIPNQSFARLMKDEQSSDGYHTPEG